MKIAAGLLIYRKNGKAIEILLGHPGGPFYTKKDNGVWTIPKGEIDKDEELLTAAKREFKEELGFDAPETTKLIELTPQKQPGKINYIWALESNPDFSGFNPGTFEIDWPPRTGQKMTIPEVDKIEWFKLGQAVTKLRPAQVPFVEELARKLNIPISPEPESTSKSPQISLF